MKLTLKADMVWNRLLHSSSDWNFRGSVTRKKFKMPSKSKPISSLRETWRTYSDTSIQQILLVPRTSSSAYSDTSIQQILLVPRTSSSAYSDTSIQQIPLVPRTSSSAYIVASITRKRTLGSNHFMEQIHCLLDVAQQPNLWSRIRQSEMVGGNGWRE